MAAIEFGHLGAGEIFQAQPGAHIERRLVEVADEQLCFGCIGHDHGQVLPRRFGFQCPGVVPGAKQAKDVIGTGVMEYSVNFIHAPHQGQLDLAQDLPPQITLKIAAGTGKAGPALMRAGLQVKVGGDQLRQGEQKFFCTGEGVARELLEVGQ